MKFAVDGELPQRVQSHPVRGAWIEMTSWGSAMGVLSCRTPSGVRGLKWVKATPTADDASKSHPVRGAWIEIKYIAFRLGCGL